MRDGTGTDSDAALLAQFAGGDQRAARQLTDSLLPGALRQAWRVLGDQTEADATTDLADRAGLAHERVHRGPIASIREVIRPANRRHSRLG